MRFLADMGLSQRVVEWLRKQGHDVVHLREQGLQRLADEAIFQKAMIEERTILTFDLDFGEILALSHARIVSVVLFRLNNTTPTFTIRRLQAILADAAEALQGGAIVVVEDGRHRIRRLPFDA
jgi:predicted nuclease of predicted toxin-antitoxin system